ncbi:MAG: protein translocase subunit SecF [Chloroflexota bacterium]|nr:protein translocase subunit SecF [Chloroflexota bacterium]MDQ5865145.1 protein translocase subunit SecF [Chloroflexota bacterium]
MIDLVGKRFLYLAFSLLIIIPGLIAIFLGGLKAGIDFTGGTRWEVRPVAEYATATERFSALLDEQGFDGALVKGGTLSLLSATQPTTDTTEGTVDTIIMDLPGQLSGEDKARLEHALVEEGLVAGSLVTETVSIITGTDTLTATVLPTGTVTGTQAVTATQTVTGTQAVAATGTVTGTAATDGTGAGTTGGGQGQTVARYSVDEASEIDFRSVGPTVGRELVGRAFWAIMIASLAILLYLTLVFRKVPNALRYGICAIIALLHDVLVVLGIFAILGLLFDVEIDALFITALLTVIGFSVHDTIVVFDRTRENIIKRRFERFEDVVNYSLVQTLARSINTSITVLLTLVALYLFGGASIRNFVLTLLIGIMSGTFSSIFTASMLLVVWEKREWGRMFGRSGPPPAEGPTRRAATARR